MTPMPKDLGPEPWNHLPGGRQPAPGALRLVQSLVNTTNLESGQDAIASREGLRVWLQQHGLIGGDIRPTQRDAGRARDLREGLRALLLANAGVGDASAVAVGPIEQIARSARLTLVVCAGGRIDLASQRGGVDGALGRILAAAHAAMLDGSWRRLKACRNHGCHWAFYDRSKNLSGSWCSMQICGNRRKTRAYRRRRHA
jgi:predicted RNA-binding Zn ribbon-like protein